MVQGRYHQSVKTCTATVSDPYKGSSAAAGAVQSGIDLAALGHNKHTPAAVTVLAFCGARAGCVFDADRRFFPQREKEKYLMSFVACTWLAGCHCHQRK